MNTLNAKQMDYRYFLCGMVAYKIFEILWYSLVSYTIILERFRLLNPFAVTIGRSLFAVLVVVLIFRKVKLFQIKWIHIAGAIVCAMLLKILNGYVVGYLHTHNPIVDTLSYEHELVILTDVRKWAGLASKLLIIVFFWWRLHSKGPDSQTVQTDTQSFSFYSGILFWITFSYAIGSLTCIACEFRLFVLPLIVTASLLMLLVTIGCIFLLARKMAGAVPIVLLLLLVAVDFFTQYYLPGILSNYFAQNVNIRHGFPYTYLVSGICMLAFFLSAYILYRKEMKMQQ